MIAVGIDESRCSNCDKLLFRGVLGIGFIETKCSRCGTVNIVHNFDGILEGRSGAYIIVCNPTGDIIIASKSVKAVLGYDVEELCAKSIHDICACPEGVKNHMALPSTVDSIASWEKLHAHMPPQIVHLTKAGKQLTANARYYPLHALSSLYTMCVFYTGTAAVEPAIGIEQLLQGHPDQSVSNRVAV